MPSTSTYQAILMLGLVSLRPRTVDSFLGLQLRPMFRHHPSTATWKGPSPMVRFARAAKKKGAANKAKASSATSPSPGGFAVVATSPKSPTGRSTGPPNAAGEDYSAFPALEPQVAETLVPCPAEWPTSPGPRGGLPQEIYDRLDQIYGFPRFNYGPKTSTDDVGGEGGGDSLSYGDLLSSRPDAGGRGGAAGGDDAFNFAELLASATGGEEALPLSPPPLDGATPLPSSKVLSSDEMRAAISSLPPFEKLRVLHVDPLVLTIDDFFSAEECDRYVDMSLSPSSSTGDDRTAVDSYETRSKTVGKDAAAKAQRTSTTWFHHYKNAPELMAKASRLIGLDGIDRWEEPQTVRYRRNERFTWHLDALAPQQAKPELGGQRTATLLVYLKDVESGGATIFRDLVGADDGKNGGRSPLKVQPKKGTALLFFPAAGGIPNTPFDIRTLHCGEVVTGSTETAKWISQLWLRQTPYTPSAPPGNLHELASEGVIKYCAGQNQQ